MTNDGKNPTAADVLMLTGEHCSYCAPMKKLLTELKSEGYVGKLSFVSIEQNAELARELGVRSVPWLQIGPFELTGSHTRRELLKWLTRAAQADGIREYLEQVLSEGDIDAAKKLVQRLPGALDNIIQLMADANAKINVRLGVGVIIEDMAESDAFKTVIPKLEVLLKDADARVRGDACHYLSLTREPSVMVAIEALLDDDSPEVREIAQESLEALRPVAS